MSTVIQRIPAPPVFLKKEAVESAPRTLIDQLLDDQALLQTPVARFAETHEETPDLEDHYRSLIPLSKPGSGEQYAFEVSLDRCTGCKACVSACHSLNGLDEEETWRDVGALSGGADAPGWQQTVTTACHHCEDPGCMNGCPVGAYEKDEDTGIVRHLDDQCIGCSYCILKCPYDVPKYSKKRGIVRKCDMCHQRLAEGEAPACVQACPTEAIRIVTVNRSSPGELIPSLGGVAASAIPNSAITRPTTRYVGREVPATAVALDRGQLTVQHAHWPLVLMLSLTQAGIGLLAASVYQPWPNPALFVATLIFFCGMAASVFHLGQPLKAWRFFLGLRTSWLSREILAFSMFAPIPVTLCGIALLNWFPEIQLPEFAEAVLPLLTDLTRHSVIPIGLLAVFTSVMIYHDTHRALWRLPRTALRFFGTSLLFAAFGFAVAQPGAITIAVFTALMLAKLLSEVSFLWRYGRGSEWSPDAHSAKLLIGPLRKIVAARFVFALSAMFTLPFFPWMALPFLVVAEILERQLFFQSVQSPKMPGNFGPAASHP